MSAKASVPYRHVASQAQSLGPSAVAAGPTGSPLAPESAPAPVPASTAAGPAAIPAASPVGSYNVTDDGSSPPAAPGGLPWQLLFLDDFQGSSLDQSKWNYVLGDGSTYGLHGFSNGEVVSALPSVALSSPVASPQACLLLLPS